MRVVPILNHFTSGELSPRLEGRTDLKRYFSGARKLINAQVHPHGGASSRFGLRFVSLVKDSDYPARVIPFTYSTDQAYIIEVGEDAATGPYCRFFKDSGVITGDGVTTPYEIDSPYSSEDLFSIQYDSTAQDMYLVHPDYPPEKLTREDHDDWSMSEVEFIDGPFHAEDTETTGTVTAAAVSGDGVTMVATESIFQSGHAGALFRIQADDEQWYYAKIVSVDSLTEITTNIQTDLPNLNPCEHYRFGAWSTKSGFPSTLALYEQRAVYAATADQPDYIWGSEVANVNATVVDYETFTPDQVGDSNPFTYQLSQSDRIRSLVAAKKLVALTAKGESIISSGTDDEIITPTRIKVRTDTTEGSGILAGIHVGPAVLFIQRCGRKLRELAFRYEADNYEAPDLSILAEHIMSGGVKDWAYQKEPDSILWIVRNDGVLVGFTYDRAQEVLAWHRHKTCTLAGDSVFESVAVIPEDSHDQVWFIIKRVVNGQTIRTVEYLEHFDMNTADVRDLYFVDSGLSRDVPFDVATITAGTPAMVETATGHGFSDGTYIQVEAATGVLDGEGISIINDRHLVAENCAATSFDVYEMIDALTVAYDTTTATAYISGGEVRELVESVSGLDHLEGETVQILADGAVQAERTVSAGAVTLDRRAGRVHVGLGYTAAIEPMRIEAGTQDGTSQGRTKKIFRLIVRFYKTIGARIGPSSANMERIPFRQPSDLMGSGPALFSGDKGNKFPGGWDTDGFIRVEQDQPLPMTVLAIAPKMVTND